MTPCCLICIDVTVVLPVFISNILDKLRYCETSEYTPNYTASHRIIRRSSVWTWWKLQRISHA